MLIRLVTFLVLLATTSLLKAAENDVVFDTAERYVRLQTQGSPGKVQITMGRLDVSRLPSCTAHEAFAPPGTRLSGKTHVGVRCLGPNVWSVLVPVQISISGTYVTTARPLVADAALAAVTEMVQTEVGMDLATEAGDPEVLAWTRHGSTREQPQFRAALPARAHATPMGAAAVLSRLSELGHPALGVDLTLPGDPLPSVRVLVPGLCAMRERIATPRFSRLCPDAPGPVLPEPY